MSFGRVGSDGVGVCGAGWSVAPSFSKGFYTPVQVIFAFPFLEQAAYTFREWKAKHYCHNPGRMKTDHYRPFVAINRKASSFSLVAARALM